MSPRKVCPHGSPLAVLSVLTRALSRTAGPAPVTEAGTGSGRLCVVSHPAAGEMAVAARAGDSSGREQELCPWGLVQEQSWVSPAADVMQMPPPLQGCKSLGSVSPSGPRVPSLWPCVQVLGRSQEGRVASAGPDVLWFTGGGGPVSPRLPACTHFYGGWGVSSPDIFIGLLAGNARRCFSNYCFAGTSLLRRHCEP